jgi:SAM-dependent methyltransferase
VLRAIVASRPQLPARYEEEWGADFWRLVNRALRPEISILDVGAGRRPTIAEETRPAGVHYVGLDSEAEELESAPAGAYDEVVVADAQTLVPELVRRFDLIVSWQALEHFEDLTAAAEAFRRYLKPDGWLVACLSGRYAAFAVANRLLPDSVGRRLVAHLMRRPVESVFRAYYDECHDRGLRRAFAPWQEVEVIPLWRGANYFSRLPGIRALYLHYENWAEARRLGNLATHYVIAARA